MSDRWKQKCLQALEECERSEQELASTQRLLRLSVSRLSLAATGIDGELDENLAALRRGVKENPDPQTMTRQLDRLSATLQRIDREASRAVPAKPAAPTVKPTTPGSDPKQSAAEPRFVELLELLALDGSDADDLRSLKSQLLDGLGDDQWRPVLGKLAELMTRVRRRGDHEVELTRFLKQLTDRLQEIDQSLVGTDQCFQDSIHHGQQLAQGVDVDLGDLQRQVDEAVNLPDMKQAVAWQTEQIHSRLKQFRAGAAQRQTQWEDQQAALKARLSAVESESAELKESLSQARRQANHDALTGLMSRLAYDTLLAEEVAHWNNRQVPLSLVVCDIDRFKRLNDTLGHQAGDKVLQSVAEVIRTSVRRTDHVARYGGEEFVVLLPNAQAREAAAVAEKIRHNVEAAVFRFQGKPVPVTLSCGYAQFSSGDTSQSCFARADKYLYAAKDGGRNQVRGELSPAESTLAD